MKRVVNNDIHESLIVDVFTFMRNELFHPIMKNMKQRKIILRLIKALNESNTGHYRTSYIIAWSLLESYLDDLFNSFVTGLKGKGEECKHTISVNNDTIKVQKVIDTYHQTGYATARDKIHILNDQKSLPIPSSELDKFRAKRGEIIHHWKSVGKVDCQKLLHFLKTYSNLIFGIELNFNELGHPIIG